MKTNCELVHKGLNILHNCLAPLVLEEMRRAFKDAWWQAALEKVSRSSILPDDGSDEERLASLDVSNCLWLVFHWWHDVFEACPKLTSKHQSWCRSLIDVRKEIAHIGIDDYSENDTMKALNIMFFFCETIDAQANAQIQALIRTALYGSEQGSAAVKAPEQPKAPAKKVAAVVSAKVGNSLPSWRDIMPPHPDVAEGRYEKAEFAVDLAQVARGEGTIEYRDPVEFFNRTFITNGMKGLLVQALRRLHGEGGAPVIQLKTAFGGGKTHSMLALYHMVNGAASREYLRMLDPVLESAGMTALPKARVAVLVGTDLNPAQRKKPTDLPGYGVNTIWGEMAHQLVVAAGKPELYGKYVRDADRKGVSPGSANLKNLFDECGPCLILMDELVAYARNIYGKEGLPAGNFDNFINFIQHVTEAARASANSMVVASIPASDIEIGGEAGKKALRTIEHTFGRMEAVWKPVAADEGFEVVRRRLFQDCQNEQARDAVCQAFSEMYQEQSGEFPPETKEVDYCKRLQSCYPIHPEVFDRLYGDWATLEKFQRTRGVLRLMASVISALWMANDTSAMIMPGSVPLDVDNVRAELMRYIPETWNTIVDTEVDGRHSASYKLDQDLPRFGRVMAVRRVARTVMLGSAPSSSGLTQQGVRGLEKVRIMLGVVQPEENVADFQDALDKLRDTLTYLYSDSRGSRFWYDTKPTLRKMAEDRASQRTDDEVVAEVEKRLKSPKKESPFAGVHVCPSSSNDVPDLQELRLVVLRLGQAYCPGVDSKALDVCADILGNRGTSPRNYRNTLAFVAPDGDKLGTLKQEVRRFLAWTSILEDSELLNLDASQCKEAKKLHEACSLNVDRYLRDCYRWLLIPSIDPEQDLKKVQWEDVALSGDENIVPKVARELKQCDGAIVQWAPSGLKMCLDDYLWRDSNHIQIKRLWEYLCSYCYLPRLANYEVLADAIREGLESEEYFGLADSYSEEKGRYVNLRFNQGVTSLNESYLLVKPEVAKRQIESEAKERSQNETVGAGILPCTAGKTGGQAQTGDVLLNERTGTAPEVGTPQVRNKRFRMSALLDNTRVNRDVSNLVQEIVQHLQTVDGGRLTMRLEVEMDAEQGIPPAVVRTVSENCNTLKVEDYGFYD